MLAVPDHNVPTTNRLRGIDDLVSREQVETLDRNCQEFGIQEFMMNDKRQGIVHVIGPEEGFTLPGTTIVCGDSHTSTHGAFGALAFGIGPSEVEHVASWVTSPEMVVPVTDKVPNPAKETDPVKAEGMRKALIYMGLTADTPIDQIAIDKVFIGSCTNARIEDLRAAAAVIGGRKVAANVTMAMVVPGSGLVREQAETEGLDKIFLAAGFEWREPGCSMCLAMNADRLEPGVPIWSVRPWRPLRRLPVTSSTSVVSNREPTHASYYPTYRDYRAPRSGQRRHGCHHPQAISEIRQAQRVRPQCLRRLALSGSGRTRHGSFEAAQKPRFHFESGTL
jgi:homoaconitase/3-isopropylmalate dehydratase large subunit